MTELLKCLVLLALLPVLALWWLLLPREERPPRIGW